MIVYAEPHSNGNALAHGVCFTWCYYRSPIDLTTRACLHHAQDKGAIGTEVTHRGSALFLYSTQQQNQFAASPVSKKYAMRPATTASMPLAGARVDEIVLLPTLERM